VLQESYVLCDYLFYFTFFPDQVHTPDSSRYWIANSYEEKFSSGIEPENVDKVITFNSDGAYY
jgi:phosphoribosylaminoimidazole-succinocarboxamide synthase